MFQCTTPSPFQLFQSCKQFPSKVKKIGNYNFSYDNIIGRGTYSSVYAGMCTKSQMPVAIKVIDLQMIKQKNLFELLFQQTQLLKELNHPNIIKCYSLIKTQNRCFIITELCQRDNLQQLIEKAKNKRLPPTQIDHIIFDIYQGLQYLAQKAIIHRDLKTANILFSQQGKAKIADFGFAAYGLKEYKDNVFIGTPIYMSPQAILEQRYSAKTDIWSFGVIIYQLLLGKTPLSECKNESQLLDKIVKPIEISQNQKIPSDLKQMIEGCLQPNCLNRWNIDKLSKCAYITKLKLKYSLRNNMIQPLILQHNQPLLFKQSSVTHATNCDQLIITKQLDMRYSLTSQNSQKMKIKSTPTIHQLNSVKKGRSKHKQQKYTYKWKQFQQIKFSGKVKSHKIDNSTLFNTQPSSAKEQPTHIPMTKIKSMQPILIQSPQTNFGVTPIDISKNNFTQLSQRRSSYCASLNQKTIKMLPKKINKVTLKKVQSADSNERKIKIPTLLLQNFFKTHSFSLFRNKPLTCKQIVSLIHYCRLLQKILLFQRYENKHIKQWLLFLIQDIKQNVKISSMKQQQYTNLKNTLNNSYYQLLNKQQNIIKKIKNYYHQFLPFIQVIFNVIKKFIQIDSKNYHLYFQRQLLLCLQEDTRILMLSLSAHSNNFQIFAKQSKSEVFLDWYNNRYKEKQRLNVRFFYQ